MKSGLGVVLNSVQAKSLSICEMNQGQNVVLVRDLTDTSRHLPHMVADREFRADLYYRLNVFPIRLPALRDRPEDIPLLMHRFVQIYARRLRKSIECIPIEVMKGLARYSWPGKVRELQNLIERAVVVSSGKILQIPLAELEEAANLCETRVSSPAPRTVTLNDAQREHILQALAWINWRVAGHKGAATRLGLKHDVDVQDGKTRHLPSRCLIVERILGESR